MALNTNQGSVFSSCDPGRNVAISQSIKISIGIAMFPRDGTSTDALVRHADKAMYNAKQNKTGYAFDLVTQ